ncbi:MAG TPA: DUF885 domain-containing protein [Chloroflexota bacterium]|nr:DUF885 domain-containing protein [Chloroflexota bacterium]
MSAWAELGQAFLDETFQDSPVLASQLGVDGFDDQLDDLSESAFEDRRRRSADWLRRFDQLGDAACDSFDERLDRDLIRAHLHGEAILDDWLMWRRQPEIYLNPGLTGVFTLFLHRLKPEPDLVQAAVSRLRAIPRALEDGRHNLRPELTPPVYVDRAIRQARAGARFVGEVLANEVADPELRAFLADWGGIASGALEVYADFLEDLRPHARGEWAIGHERYSRLLREKELLADDATTLRERGRREYDRLAEDLRRYARQIDGTDDWPRVLEQLNRDHPRTPEEMLQAYAEWTARSRQFLVDRALVTLPDGEECLVEPSPLFERPVTAVASYAGPPPFSSAMRGHFFVPFPPDGASDQEIQERLENNSFPSIPNTSVHEAYPGHHWHLVTAKGNPSRIRRSFDTAYFIEGWGLYAENLMREQGFLTDPRHEMCQIEGSLFRAARIIVDTSLHIGDMSFEQAVDFMHTRANLPEPTARAEVARYCAWPTQASAYLTGCLEILRIRDRFLKERGGTLREFHDRLAASGGLPIALAEQAVLTPAARLGGADAQREPREPEEN